MYALQNMVKNIYICCGHIYQWLKLFQLPFSKVFENILMILYEDAKPKTVVKYKKVEKYIEKLRKKYTMCLNYFTVYMYVSYE